MGGILFFFGVGSCVLYFLNMEFVIMAWIDLWGPTVGWIIRGAMTLVGAVLWVIGLKAETSEQPQASTVEQ